MHETDAHFYNVEQPAGDTPLPAGRHVLRGWLVPKPSHHFTDIRARVGARWFPGVYGFPRTDLAAHFAPERPWLLAEFSIAIDFLPGSAVIQLEALEITGHWQPVGMITYQVAQAESAPPPAPVPLRAHEFARALPLWLKAEGDQATAIAAEIPWPRAVREAHPPIFGFLDEPAAISPALYGRLHVLGWLFHESQPLRRAFATADLVTLQPLELGGEFTGVRQVFDNMKHAVASQIFGFVDVPAQLPAPVCIRVYGELADGSLQLCLAVRCWPIPTEQLKTAWPVFSLSRFWRGWRRMRNAWRQLGVPMEGGFGLWQESLKVLREYRRLATLRFARPSKLATRTPTPANATKPRRLLLISHNLNYEGAPLCLLEIARYLARHDGVRLLLLTPQDGPLRAAYQDLGAEVRVVAADALYQSGSPAAIRRAAAAIAATLDWSEIDLVVANTVVSFWGVPLAQAAGKRVLLYIHESTTPAAFFARAFGRGVLPSVYAALREADAVSFTARSAQAYYTGLRTGDDFLYTPGWIDVTAIDEYRSRQPRADARAKLGLSENQLLVINLGSVCDRKGQHVFVSATEMLWRRHPALAARSRFIMVGARENDPYNQFLRSVVSGLGRPNLELVPETGGAYDYLHAADLFVCTSYEESFPRVVAEAMAFGLPIVASAVHGIPGMVEHEVEAILVPPGDTEALLTGLVRFLGAPEEARRWGARARARVERDFRTEVVLPLHSALVSGLAAARR